MQPGSLIGFAVVFVLVAWTLSLVGMVLVRVLRSRLSRWGSATERGAAELVIGLPVVLASLVVATLLASALVGDDHCLEHHHDAHFCLIHGAPWSEQWWAVALVAAAVGLAIVRGVRLAVSSFRRLCAQARLRTLSREADGIRWIDTPEALCFVAGVTRPEIFVSTGVWAALDEDERMAMLAHERAHIRHGDIARRCALELLSIVGSPVSWVRAWWDAATERLCDARAVAETGDSAAVASAMVKVSRLAVHAHAAPTSFPPRADELTERVHAVLAERGAGDRASRLLACGVLALVFGVVLVVAWHADALHDALEAMLG